MEDNNPIVVSSGDLIWQITISLADILFYVGIFIMYQKVPDHITQAMSDPQIPGSPSQHKEL